jgi:hypothetical protein
MQIVDLPIPVGKIDPNLPRKLLHGTLQLVQLICIQGGGGTTRLFKD